MGALSDEDNAWYDSDNGSDGGAAADAGPVAVTDPEVWMDHWSEELVTLWHSLHDHTQAMGCAILDKCNFPKFAEFCFHNSSGYPPVV